MRDITGSNYEATKNLSENDLIKLIRKELRAATDKKVSLRKRRGGYTTSFYVTVSWGDDSYLNPEYVKCCEDRDYDRLYGRDVPRLTPEADALYDKLNSIIQSYNRDRSDPMTDYFDVAFYSHLSIEE